MKKVVKYENNEDIRETELVRLSRKLLDSVIANTGVLNKKKMTPEFMKENKLVLGFLNSTTKAIQTKMQFFKMIDTADKIEFIKKKK